MNKLRIYREEAGLSQIELSDLLNIGRHKIQTAEAGVKVFTQDEVKKLKEILVKNAKEIPEWLSALVCEKVEREDLTDKKIKTMFNRILKSEIEKIVKQFIQEELRKDRVKNYQDLVKK